MNHNDKESQELLSNLSFCVIDLETTGGNHEFDQIIEIGMVRVENMQMTEEMNYLIDPEIPIPSFIQKLTSITEKKVKNAPKIDEVIDTILDFIGDSILVAHNTSFDIPFLNAILKRLNKDKLTNKVLCTNVMTKYLIPEIMSSNLNYMSQVFHIEHAKAHRAIEDAKATAQLLQKYLDFFIQKNIRKVNQLYYPRNKFEIDRTHLTRKTDIQELNDILDKIESPFVITFKGEQGIIVAAIPVLNSSNKMAREVIEKVYKNDEWKLITIRMMAPYLRCLLYVSPHIPKMNADISEQILNYLNTSFPSTENAQQKLSEFDFIIGKHLIHNQFTLFPLTNLGTNNYLIFKYPSHKKKFLQYLCGQKNKFDKQLKKRRRTHVDQKLLASLTGYLMQQQDMLHFRLKEVSKKQENAIIKKLEDYANGPNQDFNFPEVHL